MQDEIATKVNPLVKSSYILNYDNSYQGGSHWVGLFIDKSGMKYFDSFGVPPMQPVIDLSTKFNIPLVWNTEIIQPFGSVCCGELASAFIVLMEKNRSFNEVIELMTHKF